MQLDDKTILGNMSKLFTFCNCIQRKWYAVGSAFDVNMSSVGIAIDFEKKYILNNFVK